MAYGCGMPYVALPEGTRLPDTFRLWPDQDKGPWSVTIEWAVVDGRPECIGYAVRRAERLRPPLEPLTASAARAVKLAEIIAEDRAGMSAITRAEPGVGLRRSTAGRFQEAADIYQAAIRAGLRPTKAVAEHFGISQGNASNLVARARAAGFLPPTSAGVPMG